MMVCFCCGEDREAETIAALRCHPEAKICRVCIGWLSSQVSGVDVTPTLPVLDMGVATRFYEAAGFEVNHYDGGFAFVSLDEQSVFDLDLVGHLDPRTNAAGCYIITKDVDRWHQRFGEAGMPVTEIKEEPWGMREFTLTDPSGNHLRIGRSVPASEAERS